MAYQDQYDRPDRQRINYHELEQSNISSRAILITIGVIAAAIVAMFMFGEVTTTDLDPASTGQVAPLAPAEPATVE